MTVPPELLHFQQNPLKVLDQGSIQLLDCMGNDQAIVNAARISYGEGTKRVSKDRQLLRYLMRGQHTSPFEMCEIVLRIKAPIVVLRQLQRHRTASMNEASGRYSVMEDCVQKTSEIEWRLQATDNKQGSGGNLKSWPDEFVKPDDADGNYPEGGWVNQDSFYASPGSYLSAKEEQFHEAARALYEERLKFGVAREQARKDLPLSLYTNLVWKMDLRNLLHFLNLRMDSHAQLEIRAYADAVASIVKVWVPQTWEAFEDYALEALTFSRMELKGLAHLFQFGGSLDSTLKASGLTERERQEFETKLRKIYKL